MEKDPLNGLRGLAALHVMLHHLEAMNKDGYDLNGSMEMPLFYLLSGYSLTLAYGSTENNNWPKYFRNRFIRIAPLYWLINLVSFIPCYYMYVSKNIVACGGRNGHLYLNILLTLTCTNSWFFPVITPSAPVFPFSEASWTVNTLFFFYLVFPALLPRLQTLSDKTIARLIVILFYIQCLPLIVWLNIEYTYGYWTMYANPVVRLPVFLMGCLGGLQTLRWREGEKNGFEDPNESRIFLHDILPWGAGWAGGKELHTSFDQAWSTAVWTARADRSAILYLGFFICGLASEEGDISFLWTRGYCQLLLVHLQLTLIMGVSRAGSRALYGRICSSPPFQFLGRKSYSIYLLHHAILRLVVMYKLYDSMEADVSMRRPERLLVFLATILLSNLVQEYLEKPLLNLFKPPSSESGPLSQIKLYK